uniref:Gag-Pol polyprotein n=1 Tax=Tanacetum cinerariifolium TaxID=118510 RepID=A0A6L2N423_TANCI|nr:hypothetical protein [Tanacetum cinerariifolium]
MQVNVQFLQQLQPEWSRFVTIVKQQHKLDEVSYHKLFDILKQYQKEVNELRAKRLARNANPLALVATAQANQDPYYQTSKKPKRVKDSAYHKEKMLLCKQPEKGIEARYSYMAKIQEVPTADSDTDSEPLEQVQNDARYNVFANKLQHYEESKSISNTCLVETDDSNVIPDLPDMCDDDIQNDQNDVESDDERVALANLKFDVDENKKIQKQLKKANTTLGQELIECKTILAKTSKNMRESNSVRDSCLLNETLGQLAQKDIEIKEGLKLKAYEISVVKEKHDELIKQSLLTKSHYEGLVKQKTKVITDLNLKLILDGEETLALERES